MWRDFRPTLFFLFRFFLTYALLSAAYGYFIKQYDEASPSETDPITKNIVVQLAFMAEAFGYEVTIDEDDHRNYAQSKDEQTYDSIRLNNVKAIAVEEGCNGISVMILFVAFVLAFGGSGKKAAWFIPLGLAFIHIANILRLFLLALLKIYFDQQYFYFFHKYGFTAVLYAAVFLLWYIWVQHIVVNRKSENERETTQGSTQ